MTFLPTLTLVMVAVLIAAPTALASVAISVYSQTRPPSGAGAGASITVTSSRPGSEGSVSPPSPTPIGGSGEGSGGETATASAPPGREAACITAGEGNISPCYGVTPAPTPVEPAPARPGPARPPVNPAALAASLATRMSLMAGEISASPTARTAGLTGAASWFWLEPTPAAQSISASLRGEQVTVTATIVSVQWGFGDETRLTTGPGVPYRPGSAPAGAVRHIYRTRCLPGDQGHDPYVLSSCGPNGYHVEAAIQWRITYQASGPVTSSGALPSRSASTSLTYPVSEARAFLTARGER
jgi:hypothetical protein